MPPWLGHLIELIAVGLFAWCWFEAPRERRDGRQELVVAVLYGWLLETADMWVFGTYHYGPMTWWWIGDVPLYIPLLWAAIVHSSMALSDRAGLAVWARPVLDGLLAVLIDLAVDAIAIRAGLWHWRIPLDEGWFGVPAGNLCAWMWVAFWYSAMTRLVRARIDRGRDPSWHRWLIPVFAYTGLFCSLYTVGWLGHVAGLRTHNERLWNFAAHVAAFSVMAAMAARRRVPRPAPIPPSLISTRWAIHVSFFALLMASGLWNQVPALLVVSLGSMMVEALVARWSLADS